MISRKLLFQWCWVVIVLRAHSSVAWSYQTLVLHLICWREMKIQRKYVSGRCQAVQCTLDRSALFSYKGTTVPANPGSWKEYLPLLWLTVKYTQSKITWWFGQASLKPAGAGSQGRQINMTFSFFESWREVIYVWLISSKAFQLAANA